MKFHPPCYVRPITWYVEYELSVFWGLLSLPILDEKVHCNRRGAYHFCREFHRKILITVSYQCILFLDGNKLSSKIICLVWYIEKGRRSFIRKFWFIIILVIQSISEVWVIHNESLLISSLERETCHELTRNWTILPLGIGFLAIPHMALIV